MKPNAALSPTILKEAVKGVTIAFVALTLAGVVTAVWLISEPDDASWVVPSAGLILITLFATSGIWAMRLIDRAGDQTETDPLTGLMNRTAVRTRITQLLKETTNETVAVALIDLDDFRTINDVWGHLVGDEALVIVTERLRSTVGPRGFVGRLGGVEFLAAWVVDNANDANKHACTIIEAIKTPAIDVGGASLMSVAVRCGLQLQTPGGDGDIVAILRDAEVALVAAKAQETELVRFDPTLSIDGLKNEKREADLRDAVERSEFEIHFQPEVDISDGAVTGAEALLRWRQPDGSHLNAMEFIDDLHRFGMTDLLTPLLVSQCERLAAAVEGRTFTVRLNFDGVQLRNSKTLSAIAAANARTAIEWCLEITEQTILSADKALLTALGELVGDGVTLALDDFGTGYSSLSELRDLPITTVKIDRSFVRTLTVDNAASSLVSIIHDMAGRLSFEVIAEGIETEQQRLALASIGCRHGQGWLFGKAVPIDEFVTLVGPVAPPRADLVVGV